MRAKPVVIGHILRQQTREMPLSQYDDMIEHLSAYTANDSLDVGILPRTPRRDEDFLDAHVANPPPKRRPIDAIAISQEIPWCLVPRKCFHDLLRRPRGRGMLGYVKAHDSSPFMRQDHKHEEDFVRDRRDAKKVEGDQVLHVILEKGLPRR